MLQVPGAWSYVKNMYRGRQKYLLLEKQRIGTSVQRMYGDSVGGKCLQRFAVRWRESFGSYRIRETSRKPRVWIVAESRGCAGCDQEHRCRRGQAVLMINKY